MSKPQKQTIVTKINDNVIKNAKSFYDAICILVDDIEQLGITINFEQIPDQYSNFISNSHNAPAGYPQNFSGRDDIAKGYPGVSGKWYGEVILLNKQYFSTAPSFSEICRMFPFIKAGTGSCGVRFNQSGILFSYDFDHIKRYDSSPDKNSERLIQDYTETVTRIQQNHSRLRTKFVENHPAMLQIKESIEELRQVERRALSAKSDLEVKLCNKFNSENKLKIDEPPVHFIKDDPRCQVLCSNTSHHSSDELESAAQRVNEIVQEMRQLVDTFPEHFI